MSEHDPIDKMALDLLVETRATIADARKWVSDHDAVGSMGWPVRWGDFYAHRWNAFGALNFRYSLQPESDDRKRALRRARELLSVALQQSLPAMDAILPHDERGVEWVKWIGLDRALRVLSIVYGHEGALQVYDLAIEKAKAQMGGAA